MLDRTVQHEILTKLREVYPASTRMLFDTKREERAWIFNAAYLADHGLIEAQISEFLGGEDPKLGGLRLKAAGLDFLEDDGGLTAILGVVTVKLHADTVKELLIAKVQASKEPKGVKASMIEAIRKLPAEATTSISMKLIEGGIDQMPNMIGWLGTMLEKGS